MFKKFKEIFKNKKWHCDYCKENYFNFQKNSWWNKKNHQPGLKFYFI
ncbi:hypothetical protein [Spiroplasma endosymbiont of Zeiraphera isertana]